MDPKLSILFHCLCVSSTLLCNTASLADFPDAFRANLYAKGLSNQDKTADEALGSFTVKLLLVSYTRVSMHLLYTHSL